MQDYPFSFSREDAQKLKEAKTGTELIARKTSNSILLERYRIIPVTRVTKAQIVVRNDADTADVKFWKRNGEQVGEKGWRNRTVLYPITERRTKEMQAVEALQKEKKKRIALDVKIAQFCMREMDSWRLEAILRLLRANAYHCQEGDCENEAVMFVYDMIENTFKAYCQEHGKEHLHRPVPSAVMPDNVTVCPNCQCHFMR